MGINLITADAVKWATEYEGPLFHARTREEADRALALVQAWTAARGLTLHPTKTKIVDAETEGC